VPLSYSNHSKLKQHITLDRLSTSTSLDRLLGFRRGNRTGQATLSLSLFLGCACFLLVSFRFYSSPSLTATSLISHPWLVSHFGICLVSLARASPKLEAGTTTKMRITFTITHSESEAGDDQDLLSLDVFPDMSIETLRSFIQTETGQDPTSQHLYHNGNLLTDNSKTLSELQINDGDMLAVHIRDMRGSVSGGQQAAQQQRGARGGNAGPGDSQDPELLRLQILGNPALRAELTRQAPDLGAAVEDPQRFAQLWSARYDAERRAQMERHRQIQELNRDPFDPEAQAKIAEIIRQERVTENLQNAMEFNPEVFGRVHMLYIDVEVNGHKVKALVDSGAQATIMSPSCAEACNIMRLVDKRYAGRAVGVGTANIIGRVHSAQLKIGSLFLPCSFTVMEGKSVDLLLGLDMLKRYQATLDLAKDKLIIQGVEIPFLGEADLPKGFQEPNDEEPRVPGPAGTTIGQQSGAVSGPTQPAAGAAAPAQAQPGAAVSTAPASGAQSTIPARSAPARTHQFPREHIEQIMALGASEDKAIQALQATGGDVEYAASLIFEGGFQ